MTGAQIKAGAYGYVDETIDDKNALNTINRALNLMGDAALVYDTADIVVTEDNQWTNLPADLLNIVEVEDGGTTFTEYRLRGHKIQLPKPGTYTVIYRRLPRSMTSLDETPEVHEAYHQCLVTYLQAWWKLRDDDENPDGIRNENMFKEDVTRVFNILRRNRRGPAQIEVIRHA